jgi:hypothetical protein
LRQALTQITELQRLIGGKVMEAEILRQVVTDQIEMNAPHP